MGAADRRRWPNRPVRSCHRWSYLPGITGYALTPDDFRERLQEQCRFLRASAAAYDAGDTAEAQRLAVTVRVLVYDKNQSVSLLQHLGVKGSLEFHDTASQLEPDEHVPPDGDNGGRIARTIGAGLATLVSVGGEWTFQPRGPQPVRQLPFEEWWSTNVSRGPRGIGLATRRDVVLALANKEGGAHVDAALEENWSAVTRAGSFASVSEAGATILNPAAR